MTIIWKSQNAKSTCESENVCGWVTDGTDQCNVKNALRTAQPNLFFNILYDNDLLNNSKENINYSCNVTGSVPPVAPPSSNVCVNKPVGAKFCEGNTVTKCIDNGGRTSKVPSSVSTCPNGCLNGECVGSKDKITGAIKPTITNDGNGTGDGGTGNGGTGGGENVIPSDPKAPTGNVVLAFKFKFQGVVKKPKGDQSTRFKVKLQGPTKKGYELGTLTVDDDGIWNGSVTFSDLTLSDKLESRYTIFVKVGKHLQKRICSFAPSESSGGTYNCSESDLPLVAGTNNLDFSGILNLVGDLPSASGEQNGVVDSYDISYVLNNLGNTDEDKLKIGDLNFDGVIDTQDKSLIIQSLNVKYDDE